MKTQTKSSTKCATKGCRGRRYGGWQTCEKCIHEQKRAAAAAAAPGIEIRFWSPGDHLVRAYVTLNGEDAGFVERKSSARSPRGYYERHRWAKGETISDETYRSTLSAEAEELVFAAIAATGAKPAFERVFYEGWYLQSQKQRRIEKMDKS